VFSLYTVCCTGCLPGVCNNPQLPSTIINQTNPFCANATCTFVPPCTSTTQNKCFKFTDNNTYVPPYAINPGICSVLYNVKGPRSYRLVGPVSSNCCGGGDPTQFLSDLDAWTSGVAYNTAVTFYVIATLEIIVMIAGIYLTCCASRETVHHLTGFSVDEDDDWAA